MAIGSWLIDRGIGQRWTQDEIDSFIREYWTTDTLNVNTDVDAKRFEPLHHGEARPRCPFPFVVFRHSGQIEDGNSSGQTSGTTKIYQTVPIQFRVHAKDYKAAGSPRVSSHDVASAVAEKIAESFMMGTPLLDIYPYCHRNTKSAGDFPLREGDQESGWFLSYLLEIEGVIQRTLVS